MRGISLLVAGTILASCTYGPTPPPQPPSPHAMQEYQQLVGNKVAGAPVGCIPNYNANDMRLMTALSSESRNNRGFGLPDCGLGVSVPTSTKPNPRLSICSNTSASLSKPAAKPTGLRKSSPATRVSSVGV